MKKAILAIAILIGITASVNVQTSSDKMKKDSKKMEMKDGVMMVGNKAMLCKDTKCTPLTKAYTCSDGCKVSTDGTITKPDGSTMQLKNGYEIGKDGKVAMIPHGQKGQVCDEVIRCTVKCNYSGVGKATPIALCGSMARFF